MSVQIRLGVPNSSIALNLVNAAEDKWLRYRPFKPEKLGSIPTGSTTHGVTGVMVAHLVWVQEARFKSGLFHHRSAYSNIFWNQLLIDIPTKCAL